LFFIMLKWLKRILLGVLALIVLLAAGLTGSVLVDNASMAGRLDPLVNTTIAQRNGPEVRAYVARPTGPGPHPAIIMIHEFWGLKREITEKADDLAAQGFVVVAPDMFRGRTTNWIPSAIYNVVSNPPAQVDGDVEAVYQWLSAQSDVKPYAIGIMGFCFGGGTSIRYSVSNPKLAATVVFYGTPVTDAALLRNVSGPVLGVFGGADSSIPQTEVDAFKAGLTAAGVPHEVTVYEGQPHAFVTDMASIRAGGPQGEAWTQLVRFLRQNLMTAQPRTVAGVGNADETEVNFTYLMRIAWLHATAHPGH
jgi:carboxymethylenebutenolidase